MHWLRALYIEEATIEEIVNVEISGQDLHDVETQQDIKDSLDTISQYDCKIIFNELQKIKKK